ncbi:hypothetical protein, partial [Leptospira ellisii]|uniref:hypothetical protein n=1 Tax=Leptospira ellisii TaxID=2023197 RepID=UPI001A9E5A7E
FKNIRDSLRANTESNRLPKSRNHPVAIYRFGRSDASESIEWDDVSADRVYDLPEEIQEPT